MCLCFVLACFFFRIFCSDEYTAVTGVEINLRYDCTRRGTEQFIIQRVIIAQMGMTMATKSDDTRANRRDIR